MAKFDVDNYVPVTERIRRFYEKYPEGRITTRLESWGEEGVVVRALVYRDRTQQVDAPDATGWAHEVPGKGPVNQTDPLENCETSAIGRALAHLGFAAKIEGGERPAQSDSGKERGASQAQLRRIRALMEERLVPDDQLVALKTRLEGTLSRAKASEIISHLEALPRAG